MEEYMTTRKKGNLYGFSLSLRSFQDDKTDDAAEVKKTVSEEMLESNLDAQVNQWGASCCAKGGKGGRKTREG